MSKSNIIFVFFTVILFTCSTAYFSVECEKLEEKMQEQTKIKDIQIMELEALNDNYGRIHSWIPLLNQLLTPLAKIELDALAEKLYQERNTKNDN